MRMAKYVKLITLLTLVMVVISAGLISAKAPRIAMVTDVGGLGDQSFNDSAYLGLKKVQKELGSEIKYLESKKMDDYESNLRLLANDKYDMIWAVGFLMTDAVAKVAKEYPKVKFGIIDSVVDLPNVLSVTFKEEEGSYLQGVVAGLATKTNVVGFVGGMESPLIEKFEAGYIAGVKAVNPKAKVLSAYTGSFADPGKGKELAITQFTQKADVIYHASGSCGTGVIEAAKEKKFLAIGVDQDQSPLAPEYVISSMVKAVGQGLFTGSKALADGKFKAGTTVLGLKDGGIDTAFSPKVNAKLSKTAIATIKNRVKTIEANIIAGKVKVPTTKK